MANQLHELARGWSIEAPVLLAYSSCNRSASCRIPHGTGPKAKRVEVRFPDPLANPYLAFAALIATGLAGIDEKLDLGAPHAGDDAAAAAFMADWRELSYAFDHAQIIADARKLMGK
mgnify:CR=1 FL=1